MGTLLKGFELAKKRRIELKDKVDEQMNKGNRAPSLTVVLVGDNPASQSYVKSKKKQAEEVGFTSEILILDKDASELEVLDTVTRLNNDKNVDGILVQLPLPKHINEDTIILAISPEKDVDGLHPLNVGLVTLNKGGTKPCTPKGIMTILNEYDIELEGKNALVIGRSRLVGQPIASLLLHKNATVTIAHSRTKNLEQLIAEHDIIVVAVGIPGFVKASSILPHHVLIDVGINRVDGKIVGDAEHESYEKAAYATPVPKGVGPMTVVSLLENTFETYLRRIEREEI